MPSFLLKVRDDLVVNLLNVTVVRKARKDGALDPNVEMGTSPGQYKAGDVIVEFANDAAIILPAEEGARLFTYFDANAETLPSVAEVAVGDAPPSDEDADRMRSRITL